LSKSGLPGKNLRLDSQGDIEVVVVVFIDINGDRQRGLK